MMVHSLNSLKRRVRKARQKRSETPTLSRGLHDQREGFQADGSFVVLHPTKGFRRISRKRLSLYGWVPEVLKRHLP